MPYDVIFVDKARWNPIRNKGTVQAVRIAQSVRTSSLVRCLLVLRCLRSFFLETLTPMVSKSGSGG